MTIELTKALYISEGARPINAIMTISLLSNGVHDSSAQLNPMVA